MLVVIFVGAVAWSVRGYTTPPGRPRQVDVAIDSSLTDDGAWHVGRNEGPDVTKGEYTEVARENTPDGGFHLTTSGRRVSIVGYRFVSERGVGFDDDGDPKAHAVVR